MARLIVKTGEGTDTLDLTPDTPVQVGRDADNQIPLPDERQASRHHCRIAAVQTGGQVAWELLDLGATNKTRVNGKPTDRRVLSSGDVIQVGKVEITFEDPEEEARLREAGSKGVCFLEWVSGDHKGEKILLEAPRTTLGRRTSNTIPLDDRMCSSHHAEITRDLNGYTVRDLGSTNGTLVGGEPTTEAPLTHGTRLRIGNSRFVFKDPSMKDIEIELSHLDEDEGWGMMGDIDLSKARRSPVGLLVGLLLIGALGVGGFMLYQQAETAGPQGGGGGDANLVDNGDMEDAEEVPFLWEAASAEAPVQVASVKRGSGRALSIRHTGGEEKPAPQVVRYADPFPALASEPLRVRASVKAQGDAALVAVWSNKPDAASGATGLTHTVRLGSGPVDVVAPKPTWADQVRIGVRLGPGSSAVLDDLRVTRESGGGLATLSLECPGDPKAWVDPRGGLDLVNSLTVLAVGAGPVARLADGTVLAEFTAGAAPSAEAGGILRIEGVLRGGEQERPAAVTWSQTEAGDGLEATVECADAAAVGLDAMLLRAHIQEGLDVLTDEGPRGLVASPGESLAGVRKTLAGDASSSGGRPRTLITIEPRAAGKDNTLELHVAADPSLLVVRHWSAGAKAAFGVVTDFEVQTKAAQEALNDAERLVSAEPGRGIERLREVQVLFPFNERVRDRAAGLAAEAESAAREEIAAFEEALQEFRIFRSADTLAALEARRDGIAPRYPTRGASDGPLENRVTQLLEAVAEARAAWYSENAGAELTRLERLADLLVEVEGYRPMAAIYYRAIVKRFGHLEGDDSFGRRVARARTQYEKLTQDAAVKEAVPR